MKRSTFYRFFPPPRFLNVPVVGVDISDSSIRCAEILETSRGAVLGRYGRQGLTVGAIVDGEIKNPDDVRAALVVLQKKHNLRHVAVSLPEERAYLVDMKLPAMQHADIRGAIELDLEEYIPLKTDEVIFDYEIREEGNEGIRVNVCVAPKTLVESYLDVFRDTGMTIVALEVEAHPIARCVVPRGSFETAMVVDFGKTRTGISVVSRGLVVFTSTILLGGESVTLMISKELGIPREAAEDIKREEGKVSESDKDALDMAIHSSVSVFRDEISKYYTYWQTHPDEEGKNHQPISKVYLCGGDANLRGLVRYLAAGFDAPVVLADVFKNTNSLESYMPPVSFNESLGYATAIGLALRQFE